MVFIPKRNGLPLADGNDPTAMQVRDLDVCQHAGILLKKLRVVPQIVGDFFRAEFHVFPWLNFKEPLYILALPTDLFSDPQIDLSVKHGNSGTRHPDRLILAFPADE